MKKFFSLLLLAALFMCSCTVSEPDAPTGDPSKVRLVAVKSMGITLISINYDKQGRFSKINAGNEMIYEFSYDGNSTTPSQIVSTAYELYDVNDKEVRKMTEKSIVTNIRVNSDGCMTACSVEAWEWRYSVKYEYNDRKDTYVDVLVEDDVTQDFFTSEYTYSNGHIVRSHDSDGDAIYYTWVNGLLMSSNDGEDAINCTYSDVENVNLQWDPNNEIFGPIAITGLFGKAPAKFVKSSEFSDGERIQYSYSLLDNGLINMCRVLNSDDPEFEPVLNYVYEKVK